MSKSEKQRTPYYPLFLAMDGRACLVVGGGEVGERKIRTLLKHGASVRLIARELTPWLDERCSEQSIFLAGRQYERAHLEGISLVFAATSDMDLNRTIARDARDIGLWCNMATDPELGSFIVPSVVERGSLSIAVSTSGLSPAIAKTLRLKLEREFGAEWEFFLDLLGMLRKHFRSRNIKEEDSRRLFSELAALPLPEWLEQGGRAKSFLRVSEICSPFISKEELQTIWDSLWKAFSSLSQRSAT
jgi:precorrin-2 dehydrogenase / sirohydrochlorin ferrochelatase